MIVIGLLLLLHRDLVTHTHIGQAILSEDHESTSFGRPSDAFDSFTEMQWSD